MNMFMRNIYRYLLIAVCALFLFAAVPAPVKAQGCTITSPSTLPSGIVGSQYYHKITYIPLFQPPQYWSIDGQLPAGLFFNPGAGIISGNPIQSETQNFTIVLSDIQLINCNKNFTLTIATMSVSGSVSPSSIRVPSGIASAQTLTHTFTTKPATNITLTSPKGTYKVGSTTIAENYNQLSANITNGRGTRTETITISSSITQKALSMGSTAMTYSRTFTSGSYTVTTQVEIRITTEAAADFRITKMQLYFQNRQPDITIKRNDKSLRTYARINYVGSGLLQGYWEVDGNFLSNVVQTISPGTTVTIGSPTPPMLPTFSSGSHRIRFVVTKPYQDIPFPEIRYYVTAEEPEPEAVKKLAPVSLLFPHNKSVISYAPITFLWTRREVGLATYFLEFYHKDEVKPLFSAYTKNPNYRLPETILKKFFSPGKIYTWKVKGFDTFNNVAAESTLFTFTMGE